MSGSSPVRLEFGGELEPCGPQFLQFRAGSTGHPVDAVGHVFENPGPDQAAEVTAVRAPAGRLPGRDQAVLGLGDGRETAHRTD
ncbi:hypothetical protein Mame01_14660 [Microbispora amethystogenes]|nr:hypothetical protein Mame01_14660 [Microbispora amethystogenes]